MPSETLLVSLVAAVLVGLFFVFIIKPLVIPPREDRVKNIDAQGYSIEQGMTDPKFWELIDHAWDNLGVEDARVKALDPKARDKALDQLYDQIDAMLANLEESLKLLDADDLREFDALMERRLYDLDRPDVHDSLDGGDDSFLYARGFIVAVGRDYYRAVSATPSLASPDVEAEVICYLAAHQYEERFGSWPEHPGSYSRETGSNPIWRNQ